MLHLVAAVEDDVRPVVIYERLVSLAGVVQLTDHLLQGVAHHGRHHAFEAGIGLSVGRQDMSRDSSCRAGLQGEGMPVGYGSIVNGVYLHLSGGCCQPQGRVAQQRVLQLVLAAVGAGLYQFVLSTAHGLANGQQAFLVGAEHVARKSKVHQPVVSLIDGTRGAEEGYGAAFPVEHRRLANVLLLSVERHDVARARHPQGQP